MTRHEEMNEGCAQSETGNWLEEDKDDDMSTHVVAGTEGSERGLPEHYENARYQQFREEAEASGFEVQHYRGRFFYEGPAIRCDELQDGFRATSVPCQHDNMGLGWIVYPR